MHLPNLTPVIVFSAAVVADHMNTITQCPVFGACDSQGAWYTDYDVHDINANEGCRNPYIPEMANICMDWGRRRGHFNFNNQGKRCIVERGNIYAASNVVLGVWLEVPCTWRLPDDVGFNETQPSVNGSQLPVNGTQLRFNGTELPVNGTHV